MNPNNREEREAAHETAPDVTGALQSGAKRRDFLRLSGAGLVLGLPLLRATGAQAQTTAPVGLRRPLPLVDARFPCRIADGVWLVPDRRISLVPNIGIVEGDRAVLVIDSGLTPGGGREVLQAARKIAAGREIILTVTHAHPEHTFGAQAFAGQAKIYYNALQRDYLARDGAKLLRGFRPIVGADRVRLLDGIRITLADEVYGGQSASLDLGGRRVEFRTWGIAHTPGDQIISVPDQKVVFVGDLIEERMFPIVPFFPPMIEAKDINLSTWEAALSDIAALKPRILVPGHGNLGDAGLALEVRRYFGEIRALHAPLKNANVPAAEVVRRLQPEVQRRHPTWEYPEFIATALRFLSA